MDNDEQYDLIAGEMDNAIQDLTELRARLAADHSLADDEDFLGRVEDASHTVSDISQYTP